MDNLPKNLEETLMKLISLPEHGNFVIQSNSWIIEDVSYLYGNVLLVHPKNELKVREYVEKRKKLMDSPLYKVLNS